MKLSVQKRLAAKVLKVSEKRITFDVERLEDIKEAITKTDIRALIGEGAIKKLEKKGTSKVRVRRRAVQRRKGLRKGPSTRKGKRTARISKKEAWMNKMRTQRKFLKDLKDKGHITSRRFSGLYLKIKGNFFRSKRHIKLYIKEHSLAKKK